MRPMVVGESFKNYSKGSPRMAGKSTHGKTNQKRNQAQNWSYWARGWRGAGLWTPSFLSHQLLPTDII